jgi:hypothetical protein
MPPRTTAPLPSILKRPPAQVVDEDEPTEIVTSAPKPPGRT